ncbi:MAG TPA: transglycosylase, partial [Deltaproteobacteria bacterium]|nr:transglycosylase [Deltaproteobacteria bacterium]
RPYWSQLKNFANQAGIDPYFALAIMREESHFDPQALSSSKAIGLMQLMPATAKAVAKRKKIKLTGKAEIFDPELNTQLGTLYLGRLSNQFKSELIYTAGSYNAGPQNMSKWINRWNGKSLDAFVEQIPFKEPRNYVKRDSRSYKLYKQIYSS